MRKFIIPSIILILSLFGCMHMPDPRELATIPVKATIPKPVFDDGVYRLDSPGIVHIIFLFPGGKLMDPPGKEGAVNLLCATMISGGTKDLGPERTEEILDDLAADVGISPEREFTYASINMLQEDAEEASKLFLDLLRSPSLDSKRFTLERKKLIDKIKRDEEDAITVAFNELKRHLYKGEPRSKRPTLASLNTITRGDLIGLYKQIFTNTPLIGIIGDLDSNSLENIKRAWPIPGVKTYKLMGMPENPEFGSFTKTAKDRQCVLVMARPGPGMNESSYPAAYIADYIIGSGGLSSRITQEIRTKKGLAYSAGSFYQAWPTWGVFGVYVITETRNIQDVKQTLKDVFDNVIKGISTEETEWAKQAITNQQSVMYNSPTKVLSHAMEMTFYSLSPDFDDIFLDRVYDSTQAEIQDAASNLVKGPWVEIVVNP
ncbi:MAG: insulinase family protein [Deltaproteobacteria bacterium]|nr:insulinase family protein [Deltaproteobacteria bacterium]